MPDAAPVTIATLPFSLPVLMADKMTSMR
jgi:hypothetical protein